MGERGPAPLPANVHLLRGNASKKPTAALLEGVHPEVLIPGMPKYLAAAAKREWKRLAPELEKLGLITSLDLTLFAQYCQEVSRIEWAELKIRELQKGDPTGEAGMIAKSPNGYPMQSPYLQILRKAQEMCLHFAKQFGLSPAMRTRVTASDNLGGGTGDLFEGTDAAKPELPQPGWPGFS